MFRKYETRRVLIFFYYDTLTFEYLIDIGNFVINLYAKYKPLIIVPQKERLLTTENSMSDGNCKVHTCTM